MNLQSQPLLAAPPYNDDYNATKNFHRVLFRPGTAVQARELTQLQTILQDQVARVGEHLFKDGSIVKGCSLSFVDDISMVRVSNFFEDSNQNQLTVDDPSLVGSILIGETTGVQATLLLGRTGFEGGNKPNRLFVRYTMPGKNGEQTFAANERINFHGDDDQYVEQFVLSVDSTANFEVGDYVTFGSEPNATIRARIVSKTATDITISQSSIRPEIGDGIFVADDPSKAAIITNVKLNVAPRTTWIRALAANHTAVSYGVSVSEGIIFHKGHFIRVTPHFTIVDEESRTPTGKVLGFITEETIVTEDIDESLYDNAAGFTNYNAPGAHRLKLVSTIVARDRDDIGVDEQFFPIVEFSDSGVVFERTDPEYARLGDEMARRTYEESGDYTIRAHAVSSNTYIRDSDSVEYTVGAGLSYVRGRRVDIKNPLKTVGRRGTDTLSFSDQIVSMTYGNFVVATEVRGFFPTDECPEVALYDTAQQAITNGRSQQTAPTGTIIGYANLRAVVFDEESARLQRRPKGSWNARYRFYLFNIRMNAGRDFADVRSIVYSAGGGRFAFADPALENGRAVLKESAYNQLVFAIGAQAVRDFRDAQGNQDTAFYYAASNTGVSSLQSDGTITFQVPNGGGILGFSDASDVSEAMIDLTLVSTANVYSSDLPGTVNAISTSNTIVGTNLDALFVPGEYIRVDGVDARVVSVANATHMVVSPAIANATNVPYQRMHVSGSLISLDGPLRTITITGNNQVTVNLGSTYTAGVPASVSARFYARKTNALPIAKELRRNTVVRINTETNEAGAAGPWCLGVPDVLRVTGVFLGSNSSTFDLSTNYVSRTRFDNGQEESHYDLATVSPLPGSESFFANTYVLIQFDHFVANNQLGQGFFSVESYPVDDDVSADREVSIRTADIPVFRTATRTYDLRDCIDFRPYKASSATITSSIPASTVNPTWVNTFDSKTTTFKPFPNENFELNFTHYLGRKDVLALTPQGQVILKEGQSALRPRLPEFPADSMPIATIDVPPYPSLPDNERTPDTADKALKINPLVQKRYTMRDISVIEQRVDRLEHYATLTALEQSTANLIVPDSAGFDRFKNGIFVDPLNSHVFGRVSDPQYAIAVDPVAGHARPRAFSEFFNLEFSDTQSSGVRKTGTVVTLDYTDEVLIDQPFATTLRQPSSSTFQWVGSLECTPRRWQEVETVAVAEINGSSTRDIVYQEMAAPPLGAMFGWWRENKGPNSDTSVSAFIRSREITVRTFNLKPFTRMFVFIDDVDVTQYAAPMNDGRRTEPWGTELRTDSRGELTFRLQIPANRFRTGNRLVTVADARRDADVTTHASGYFVADLRYEYYVPAPPPAPPPPPPEPKPQLPAPSNPTNPQPRPEPNRYVLDVNIEAEYIGNNSWYVTMSQTGRWLRQPEPTQMAIRSASINGPMGYTASNLTGPGPWSVTIYADVATATFTGTVTAYDTGFDYGHVTGTASVTVSRPVPVPVDLPVVQPIAPPGSTPAGPPEPPRHVAPSLPPEPAVPPVITTPPWANPPVAKPAPLPKPPPDVVPPPPPPPPTIIAVKPRREREPQPAINPLVSQPPAPTVQPDPVMPVVGGVHDNRAVEALVTASHPLTNNVAVTVTPVDLVPPNANLQIITQPDSRVVQILYDRTDRDESTWNTPVSNQLRVEATAVLPDASVVTSTQIINVEVTPTPPPSSNESQSAPNYVGLNSRFREWLPPFEPFALV